MSEGALRHTWLAAEYHVPSTYSCRQPMSSMASVLVTPAPGPATIRLALIRVGIECFGLEYVRDILFPIIRSMKVQVRPPEYVALSSQLLRAYKVTEQRKQENWRESPITREMAHAQGTITVYVQVPEMTIDQWKTLLSLVGYWGQANSFASCLSITEDTPNVDECVRALSTLPASRPLLSYFSCVLSEFRDTKVEWKEVVPDEKGDRTSPFRLDLSVWPLLLVKQHSGGKLFARRPFA